MTRKIDRAAQGKARIGTVNQLPSGQWRARYMRNRKSIKGPRTWEHRHQAIAWLNAEADRLDREHERTYKNTEAIHLTTRPGEAIELILRIEVITA